MSIFILKRSLLLTAAFLLLGCQINANASDVVIKAQSQSQAKKASTGRQLVYINAAAIQCEYKGKTLTETAQLLSDQHIEVLASQCAVTDRMYPSVCGGGNGALNLHKIHAADLESAKAVGFNPVSVLQNSGVGYQIVACDR